MNGDKIHYKLQFAKRGQHLVDVEAYFPTAHWDSNEISQQIFITMPVWTPGSYLVREYARNIESIEAFDDKTERSLAIQKLSKNRWSIDCNGSQRVCVRYSLYCREASVRTNWVEDEYAFLTGAATFLTLDDPATREHSFDILPPESWPRIACSLPRLDRSNADQNADSEASNPIWDCFSRRASSFDELVDSPILMGDIDVRPFKVSDKLHYLASYGTSGAWDLDLATQACGKIVATQHAFWGEIPYPSYWFINMAIESYGGLEHDNNTVLATSHWAMRKRTSYIEWLGLLATNFFHAWNVRRLRPKNLVQYDYGSEQYIPELWIAEGITSYFDDLLVLRAGLTTQAEYLSLLGKTIQQVEETPGRLVQTLKDSSFDTWIKHYRPDENAINSRISYYTKGAIVAFLLDIQLRMLSGERNSLADVMRQLWRKHRLIGYTLADFEAIASEFAETDLAEWFEKHIRCSDQLDYQPALDWLGLRLESVNPKPSESNIPPSSTEPEWEFGCETTHREGRIIVTKVIRQSPASMAGLQVDDEIIALGGHRLPKENWKDRLQCFSAEKEVVATIARRGRLRDLRLRMQPRHLQKLQSVTEPTALQSKRRHAWLFA